tara:strand:+ start:2167 stop:2952 length:786 start_codon:yes stop_codon:yes gene_type:complete
MTDLNLDNFFINKRIIVTGASRGLGAAASKALSDRGAKIVMLSRSKKKMDKLISGFKNPNNHMSISVDFINIGKIKLAIKKAKKFLKKIDIVLHVAGGGFGLKDDLIKNEDLNKLFQINLGAVAEINRLVVNSKKKGESLKLVHVGSIASYEMTGSVGYNTVKSSLAAYVRSIGNKLYKKNVVATGVLPGGFISPGNAMERLKIKNRRAYKKFINTRLPRRVMGNAEEILSLLIFLCSDHSSMMGGCLVPIDAGEGRSYQA